MFVVFLGQEASRQTSCCYLDDLIDYQDDLPVVIKTIFLVYLMAARARGWRPARGGSTMATTWGVDSGQVQVEFEVQVLVRVRVRVQVQVQVQCPDLLAVHVPQDVPQDVLGLTGEELAVCHLR